MNKEIIFAVPGSKKYSNKFYSNSAGSFLNISITGNICALNCRHCKTKLLNDMASCTEPLMLEDLVLKKSDRSKLKGILISGGFDESGRLVLKDFYGSIKKIKESFNDLKIFIHCGFVDKNEAVRIKNSNADIVLTNMISSSHVIKNVYNLKSAVPDDYVSSIKNLIEAGNKVSPHIVMGLENNKMKNEYDAVDKISDLNLHSLVFVSVRNTGRDNSFASENRTEEKEIIDLVSYARKKMPRTRISFGCAKPSLKQRGRFEISLLKMKINSIAFPSEESVRYAYLENIPFRFEETCCAF